MTISARYRIGEVAAKTGVTVDTLRFYEREGLLLKSVRTTSGARRYGDDVLGRVRFIKQAQAVGLTLRDIQVLVASRQDISRNACRQIRTILAERIEDIERRVQDMQAFLEVLQHYLSACDRALSERTVLECPTIDAIERGTSQAIKGSRS